jgi:hypothetical protein
VASVYSANDRQIRDDLRLSGPRVVTFNNILKYEAIPLASSLDKLLTLTRKGFATPVEIEFACEMGDWGKPLRRGQPRREPELYALQVRPFVARGMKLGMTRLRFAPEDILCRSNKTLGHGIERSVRDIVYVRRQTWEAAKNKAIAAEVERMNAQLSEERRPYMLIGPGRWGTADEWLGIPVQWRQISGAKAIIEASPEGYDVEPSQGTHFFQNITSLRIAYLTLPPGAEEGEENCMDWHWLDAQEACAESENLRHVCLDEPLTIVLDGKKSRGLVAKPGVAGE